MTDSRLSIRKVLIKGNKRTKASVFNDELQEAYKTENVNDLMNEIENATRNIYNLGVFDSVNVTLDKAKSGKKEEIDLIIDVKEKNSWKAKMDATSNGYEGTGTTSFTLINPLGQAETISFSTSRGYIGSASTKFNIRKRRFFGFPLSLDVSVEGDTLMKEELSSYKEKIQEGKISLTDFTGSHEISYYLGWRDIIPRRNTKIPNAYSASKSILSEAFPSLKSSMKYSYIEDQRDNPLSPTRGTYFSGSAEVAGIFGDVKFVKLEGSIQKHIPLYESNGNTFSFGLMSTVGAVKPFGLDRKRVTRISDRFFLGGPLTLRGFNYKGVGPRASPKEEGGSPEGDSLGGEFRHNYLINLSMPFPSKTLTDLGLRGQVFLNGGSLMTWKRILDNKNQWLRAILDDTRMSYGIGFTADTRIGRIEGNYSWILKQKDHDRIRQAQIGVGISFSC